MFSSKRLVTLSLLLILSLSWSSSRAADNVCVINNSSYDVTFSTLGEAVLHVGPKGGDQNKCWGFVAALPVTSYDIRVEARKGGVPEVIPSFGFVDPMISSGYFYLGENPDDHWNPNANRCSAHVCAWHTDKTDVWRLYIIDKP